MNHQLSTNPFAKTLLERKIRDVDEAAIREFKNDLKNMTVDDMERELRHVEEQIDDLEPWQEALKAALRSPDKLAKVLKK
jgi:phage shock protein A